MTSISDVRGEQEGIFPTTVPRGCHVMTTRASRPAERRCPGLPPPDDSVLDDDTNTVPSSWEDRCYRRSDGVRHSNGQFRLQRTLGHYRNVGSRTDH